MSGKPRPCFRPQALTQTPGPVPDPRPCPRPQTPGPVPDPRPQALSQTPDPRPQTLSQTPDPRPCPRPQTPGPRPCPRPQALPQTPGPAPDPRPCPRPQALPQTPGPVPGVSVRFRYLWCRPCGACVSGGPSSQRVPESWAPARRESSLPPVAVPGPRSGAVSPESPSQHRAPLGTRRDAAFPQSASGFWRWVALGIRRGEGFPQSASAFWFRARLGRACFSSGTLTGNTCSRALQITNW